VRVSIATQLNSTRRRVELSCVGEVSIATRRCNSTRRRVELRRYKRALRRLGVDHTEIYLQNTPCLPLPRKRSPDGASQWLKWKIRGDGTCIGRTF